VYYEIALPTTLAPSVHEMLTAFSVLSLQEPNGGLGGSKGIEVVHWNATELGLEP
jgi:hypothetical protein